MPAVKLFGRKWLVSSDDLVFPGLFELVFRFIWLVLLAVACARYYPYTWECTKGGELVRAYIVGKLTILTLIMLILMLLVNRSGQGAIMDTGARRLVPAILSVKILLIVPEVVWNIMGTMWTYTSLVECSSEHFTNTVVEVLVLFNWVLLALTIFGLALMFDPLGSMNLDEPDPSVETILHRKVTGLWIRRFQWFFCWVRRDEHCHEAFVQVACLSSALWRSTDTVPSDFMAGMVLLRVRQKRATRELRRLQLVSDQQPKYSSDIREVFAGQPSWMCLDRALHYHKLSMAAYGWPFVLYRYPVTGIFKLIPQMMCCACFRAKSITVIDDNCCLCNLSGVKYTSQIPPEDILYASFENHIFELPYFVVVDHKTASIVVIVRGSISLRDIFTDLTAGAELFDAPGLPPNTMAHRGMIHTAKYLKKNLEDCGVLERAFNMYPSYNLALTGHSLGAAVGVLLALLIRPKYPNLKVFAMSPPAGIISREAARVTEEFVFSVGLGDDLVMRLSVDSMEDLRTNVLHILQLCRLPKYRIMLNGFGYALFGVPSRDLEGTWKNDIPPASTPGELPLLFTPQTHRQSDISVLAKDVPSRRFCCTQLFNPGRILHITRRKKTKAERKAGTGGPSYGMRWTTAEEFTELKVMPRMLLDHLPENLEKVLETILKEQKDLPMRPPYMPRL